MIGQKIFEFKSVTAHSATRSQLLKEMVSVNNGLRNINTDLLLWKLTLVNTNLACATSSFLS